MTNTDDTRPRVTWTYWCPPGRPLDLEVGVFEVDEGGPILVVTTIHPDPQRERRTDQHENAAKAVCSALAAAFPDPAWYLTSRGIGDYGGTPPVDVDDEIIRMEHADPANWSTDDHGRRYYTGPRMEGDGSIDWSGSDGWPEDGGS